MEGAGEEGEDESPPKLGAFDTHRKRRELTALLCKARPSRASVWSGVGTSAGRWSSGKAASVSDLMSVTLGGDDAPSRLQGFEAGRTSLKTVLLKGPESGPPTSASRGWVDRRKIIPVASWLANKTAASVNLVNAFILIIFLVL